MLNSFVHMKNSIKSCEKNELEESSVVAFFFTPTLLDHQCLKWVRMADCQIWKAAGTPIPSVSH